MNRNLVLGAALIVALAACSSKTETTTTTQSQPAGTFTVATTFAPDPPVKGPETLTFAIKDAAGAPIKGATVKVTSNMPSMSMAGPTLAPTDNGDGTYSVQTNLNYATQWTFDVAVSANGQSGTAHVTQDVK